MLAAKVSVDGIFYQVNFVHEGITIIDCSDVNECLSNNGGCGSNKKCTNTVGGRICGDCPSGFVDDGNDTGCIGYY